MNQTDWTFGTEATEPPATELFDARCTCGWVSKPSTANRVNALAAGHRKRWAEFASELPGLVPLEHHTTIAPITLHGDHLAAEPRARRSEPVRPRMRERIAHLIMRTASLVVTQLVDRRAVVRVVYVTIDEAPR